MNEYSPITSQFSSAEEEAAYETWFREKVNASLNDRRPQVPHAEAIARVRATLDRAKSKTAK